MKTTDSLPPSIGAIVFSFCLIFALIVGYFCYQEESLTPSAILEMLAVGILLFIIILFIIALCLASHFKAKNESFHVKHYGRALSLLESLVAIFRLLLQVLVNKNIRKLLIMSTSIQGKSEEEKIEEASRFFIANAREFPRNSKLMLDVIVNAYFSNNESGEIKFLKKILEESPPFLDTTFMIERINRLSQS